MHGHRRVSQCTLDLWPRPRICQSRIGQTLCWAIGRVIALRPFSKHSGYGNLGDTPTCKVQGHCAKETLCAMHVKAVPFK